jgi:hypothetical protein
MEDEPCCKTIVHHRGTADTEKKTRNRNDKDELQGRYLSFSAAAFYVHCFSFKVFSVPAVPLWLILKLN